MLPCAQIHFTLLGSLDSMDLIVPQRGNQSQNGGVGQHDDDDVYATSIHRSLSFVYIYGSDMAAYLAAYFYWL